MSSRDGTAAWKTTAECDTGRMPVLDPNPGNGQKKLLLVFGVMIGIGVVISVIATIAAP